MIDRDDYIRQLEADLAEARSQLKAEQDAAKKTMDRLCKAMGRWEGCWDNAAEARLKAHSERTKSK